MKLNKMWIAAGITVALAALATGAAVSATDKYTLKVPGGLAFSEFKGYESWEIISTSQNGPVVAAILGNPAMITAFKAGIPDNGKPFPDGARMAKIHWLPKKQVSYPGPPTVAGELTNVDFMVKDSKRFADSGGWGYAVFEYDPATQSYRPGDSKSEPPQANDAKCGAGCHTIVKKRDFVFTEYAEEVNRVDQNRRALLGVGLMTLTATQLGATVQARLPSIKPGTNTTFPSIRQIDAGLLNVGYAEVGPGGGTPVLLLHGWPYDIHTYVNVAPVLAAAGYRVIVPYLRGYGTTRFLSSETLRNGQPAALAADTIALMDALKIRKAIIAGCDWGARTADVVAALWPERCKGLVAVSGYLIGNQAAGQLPLPPKAELQWWYQYYFATERGRAGYDKYRRDFARLIWQIASPQWKFDDATFDRSAAALDNPDHVDIVIHNYRWRLGLAAGEPQYDDLERRLAEAPPITVPTITLEGDANGAPHPEPSAYARKYTGRYSHWNLPGGIGHNLPQEAPQAFAEAIVEVDHY